MTDELTMLKEELKEAVALYRREPNDWNGEAVSDLRDEIAELAH